ncbi:MAG TPA: response regulator transcription factor [Dehalococcoidia bacterium]|nr:response regulator transcription factor [Dehalococcoidia bacterium]
MQPLRLLLVDDHALFREGLISLLTYQDDFTVVGEAEDAESAVEQARALEPDIVLMDIDLPGEDGVIATQRLTAAMPTVSVVMLTVHDDSQTLFEAIKAGAQGYLIKNVRSRELLEQLRGLARGEAAISRRMAARILQELRGQTEPFGPEEKLTSREMEVLELVAARLSNAEIAARLVVSEHTVKNHMKSILSKLQLHNRHQAAAFGVVRGWLPRPKGRGQILRSAPPETQTVSQK